MSKKIYCSISNHFISKSVSNDKLNYQTYIKLLEYFDEVHIYGRTYEKKSYSKQDEESQIYMHYISVPKAFFLRYIYTIVSMFVKIFKDNKKFNFTIVDASEPTTGGMIGILLNVFLKKPFLLQIQGEMTRISPQTDGLLRSLVSKYSTIFCSKFATKIRVVSHVIKTQLVEDGVEVSKIEVLAPRVNLEQFDYTKYSDKPIKLKDEFKIEHDKKLFVCVGRLVPFKGIKYLIQACSFIDKNSFHLLIVGDGELKEDLEALTRELGLQNNITFVGKVDFVKVPYFMAGADFFILPSLDEGFGRVILESMAVKTLVLASKVGGIQDIIIDKETGIFMDAANANDISMKINEVLTMDKNKINKIIEKSYEIVHDNYEFNNSMNKFIKLYSGTISKYENS